MALPAALVNSFRAYFRRYSGVSNSTIIKNDGNKYELYILGLAYEAIKRNHPAIVPQNLDSTGGFLLRCSPGKINQLFSYFSFNNSKGELFELRNGIEYKGQTVYHEVDVSVLKPSTRGNNYRPNHTDLQMALECKLYSNASSLKGEARKNMGAITDLSVNQHRSPSTGNTKGCLVCQIGFYSAFVTNIIPTNMSNAFKLLNNYDLNPNFGVLPNTASETILISSIANESLSW